MIKVGFLLVVAGLLVGCVSYPETVQVPESTNLVGYEKVNAIDSNYVNQQARWSGVIAEIKNLKDKTQLDVLYYPASRNGRPVTSKEPVGRFRVYIDKFLDPAIYKQGKAVTALGMIKEKESAKIGEFEYEYPTIKSAKIYLWPKVKPRTQVSFYYGWHGYYPRWYWNGGVRHIYVVGKGTHKTKQSRYKKDTPNP